MMGTKLPIPKHSNIGLVDQVIFRIIIIFVYTNGMGSFLDHVWVAVGPSVSAGMAWVRAKACVRILTRVIKGRAALGTTARPVSAI